MRSVQRNVRVRQHADRQREGAELNEARYTHNIQKRHRRQKMPAKPKTRSRRSVISSDDSVISMLDLSEIAMHDRTIDDGVVVCPKNHVSDFIWGNESTETIHGAEVIKNALVVANVLA